MLCSFMYVGMYVYIYLYMSITINLKKVHGFERTQEGVYGKIWKEEREEKNVITFLKNKKEITLKRTQVCI